MFTIEEFPQTIITIMLMQLYMVITLCIAEGQGTVFMHDSLIFKLCLTMCVCCVCRPVMEDIDEQFAVSEAKAREYFIDLILGLEYCKI